MDKGEIVEAGKHEELLAQHGRYYNLYTMQWAAQEQPHIAKAGT
jgi:ABC-type multidrug transport system fused ATPase/permease subunit